MDEVNYDKYKGMSLVEVAAEMQKIKRDLEDATEIKTTLQKIYDHLRMGRIPELMDEEGISSITLEGIGRVGLTTDIYSSIPNEFKDQAWGWLRENGHGDIIKETINAGTLKAVLKVLIKKGEQLPESFFKVTPYSRASITKIK